MNSESNPSSSTRRAKVLMPRARSGPSPSQTYDGRKTPKRPTSVMNDQPPHSSRGAASPAAILGVPFGEERRGTFDQVLAGEDPIRRVQLGGQARLEVDVGRQVDQPLRLAYGERATGGDLLADGH